MRLYHSLLRSIPHRFAVDSASRLFVALLYHPFRRAQLIRCFARLFDCFSDLLPEIISSPRSCGLFDTGSIAIQPSCTFPHVASCWLLRMPRHCCNDFPSVLVLRAWPDHSLSETGTSRWVLSHTSLRFPRARLDFAAILSCGLQALIIAYDHRHVLGQQHHPRGAFCRPGVCLRDTHVNEDICFSIKTRFGFWSKNLRSRAYI